MRCSRVSDMQMTALMLNNVSFQDLGSLRRHSSISSLNQTENAVFLRSLKSWFYQIIKPSAVFNRNFIHSNTDWFSSQISSPLPHLLDNNYLAGFMAEGKSLLPCQPFPPQSMVVFGERRGSHRTGLERVHVFISDVVKMLHVKHENNDGNQIL